MRKTVHGSGASPVLLFADGLKVISRPFHHRHQQLMLLRLPPGLSMDNDLVFGVHRRYPVIALNDPVGTLHLGALIVGEVAFPGSAGFPGLVVVVGKPGFELLDPGLQRLDLLSLLRWPRRTSPMSPARRVWCREYRSGGKARVAGWAVCFSSWSRMVLITARVFDAGDDPDRPAAVLTGLDSDVEEALQALGPAHRGSARQSDDETQHQQCCVLVGEFRHHAHSGHAVPHIRNVERALTCRVDGRGGIAALRALIALGAGYEPSFTMKSKRAVRVASASCIAISKRGSNRKSRRLRGSLGK